MIHSVLKAEPHSVAHLVDGTESAILLKNALDELQKSHPALENAEIANGCLLTCQSVPTTSAIGVGYKS